jgi:hypothetical protein
MTDECKPAPSPEERLLVEIAKAVSDGLPVDWEGFRAENPDALALIDRLQFIETIAGAHRRVLEQESDEDGGDETS